MKPEYIKLVYALIDLGKFTREKNVVKSYNDIISIIVRNWCGMEMI